MKSGTILGHEAVGIVEEIGKDARNAFELWQPGDAPSQTPRLIPIVPEGSSIQQPEEQVKKEDRHDCLSSTKN